MADNQQSSQRVDRRFVAQLPSEVEDWQGQGIISETQGRAILDLYQVPEAGQAAHNRLVSILAVLGSILVGLGVILFFASNWQEIPKEVKLGMMLVGVPAAYAIGYWLRYKRDYIRVGTAVLLLAALFYGAAIHLVAQAYNVPVNHPNLVLYWFLGVLPIAYVIGSETVAALAIVLFLAAIGFRGQEWLREEDLIPFRAFPLYLVLGLMLYGLGKVHAQFDVTRHFSRVFEVLGVLAAFGALYLLTFRFWWEEKRFLFQSVDSSAGLLGVTVEFWGIAAVAAALALLTLVWVVVRRSGEGRALRTLPFETLSALIFLIASVAVVFFPVDNDLLYPLLFNFLFLLGVIGLILMGYFRARETFINLALLFFGIDVVTRYFEFSFDLFDRSLVFIVAGLILLAGGFLMERTRRLALTRMRAQGGHDES